MIYLLDWQKNCIKIIMIQLFGLFTNSFFSSFLLLFITILLFLTHSFKYDDLIIKFPIFRFALLMNR